LCRRRCKKSYYKNYSHFFPKLGVPLGQQGNPPLGCPFAHVGDPVGEEDVEVVEEV
jgi:hypothetical protein